MTGTPDHDRGPRGLAAVWWRALRPFSFTASVTPVLVGSSAALHDRQFHPALFLVTLVASVAIQAATNLANEYYDHIRGVDDVDSIGPSGVIQHGMLAPRTVLGGSMVLFAAGSALGLWLVSVAGWPILAVGVLSVLAGYAYTGGPLPLGYVGLGDLVVFVFMGPAIVLGAYYVQTLEVTSGPVWASLPVAALVTAILVVNNLRDIDGDRRKGKRTIATFVGPRGTRLEYALLVALAYGSVAVGVALRSLPLLALVVFLTVPQAATLWRRIRDDSDRRSLTHDLRDTAGLHQRVGLLLAASFLLS